MSSKDVTLDQNSIKKLNANIKHSFITECGKLLVIAYAEISEVPNRKVKSIFDDDDKDSKNIDAYNMFKLNSDDNNQKVQDR